jgi:hypothetical protein
VRRIVSVGGPPSRWSPSKSQIPPWPALPPSTGKVECCRHSQGRVHDRRRHLHQPLLKSITVAAILGATYLFIVRPVLDTTEEVSSNFNDSIGQSLDSTNQQIDKALQQSGATQTVEIPQSSQDSLKEANRLLDCIQRANGNVDKIQRCNR